MAHPAATPATPAIPEIAQLRARIERVRRAHQPDTWHVLALAETCEAVLALTEQAHRSGRGIVRLDDLDQALQRHLR